MPAKCLAFLRLRIILSPLHTSCSSIFFPCPFATIFPRFTRITHDRRDLELERTHGRRTEGKLAGEVARLRDELSHAERAAQLAQAATEAARSELVYTREQLEAVSSQQRTGQREHEAATASARSELASRGQELTEMRAALRRAESMAADHVACAESRQLLEQLPEAYWRSTETAS
jgi:chromosome segregation ATPase